MNQELWELLKVNNNCRVNNHINNKKGLKFIKKNQQDIKCLKNKLNNIELTVETATGASSPPTSSATIQLPDTIRIFSNGGINAVASTGSALIQLEPEILFCEATGPPASGPPNGDIFRPSLFLDLSANVLNYWCPIITNWIEIASVSIIVTNDDIMTLTVGTDTVDLVQPPATGGKFIWCQNSGGTGAWAPEDSFDARAWIGGDTGGGFPINGTSNQLLGMTRPPIDGDKYTSTTLETKYTFDGGVWNVEPCCFNINLGLTGQNLVQLSESFDSGFISTITFVVTPPSSLTGPNKYVWCQDNSVFPPTAEWVPIANPFVDTFLLDNIQTGFTVVTGGFNIIIYDNVVRNDNSLYNNTTGLVTIQEAGDYLVNFSNNYVFSPSTPTGAKVTIINSISYGQGPLDSVFYFDVIEPIDFEPIERSITSSKIISLVENDIVRISQEPTIVNGGLSLFGNSYFQVKKLF